MTTTPRLTGARRDQKSSNGIKEHQQDSGDEAKGKDELLIGAHGSVPSAANRQPGITKEFDRLSLAPRGPAAIYREKKISRKIEAAGFVSPTRNDTTEGGGDGGARHDASKPSEKCHGDVVRNDGVDALVATGRSSAKSIERTNLTYDIGGEAAEGVYHVVSPLANPGNGANTSAEENNVRVEDIEGLQTRFLDEDGVLGRSHTHAERTDYGIHSRSALYGQSNEGCLEVHHGIGTHDEEQQLGIPREEEETPSQNHRSVEESIERASQNEPPLLLTAECRRANPLLEAATTIPGFTTQDSSEDTLEAVPFQDRLFSPSVASYSCTNKYNEHSNAVNSSFFSARWRKRTSQAEKDEVTSRWCNWKLFLLWTLLVSAAIAGVAVFLVKRQGPNDSSTPDGMNDHGGDDAASSPPKDWEYHRQLRRYFLSTNLTSFGDPDSPQNRALQWLAFEDSTYFRVSDASFHLAKSIASSRGAPEMTKGYPEVDPQQQLELRRIEQRYALMVFYYANNGLNWSPVKGLRGWAQPGVSECDWSFLGCDEMEGCETGSNNVGSQIVKSFELSNEETSEIVPAGGSLPKEMGFLRGLQVLQLTGNRFEGSIPDSLYTLTDLCGLGLKRNELSSTISTEVGKLSNLIHLALALNYLSGTFPTEMAALTKLSFFSAFGNRFVGSEVWDLIQDWRSLEFFFINNNYGIVGTIPTEIGLRTGLKAVEMSNIDMSGGTIPSEIGKLTSLFWLTIEHNNLQGTIPSELVNCPLEHFLAAFNPFDYSPLSRLLTSATRWSNMHTINLSAASLTGTIPTEIGLMTSLQNAYFVQNFLTGTVPSEIGQLFQLQKFDARVNDLVGTVPEEVCALSPVGSDVGFSCDVECPETCCTYHCTLLDRQ